jgi:hypothetical protein
MHYLDQWCKTLFTNPETISNFKAAEGCHEASCILRAHVYYVPPYKVSRHVDLVLGICTPVLQMNFILQWCRRTIADFIPQTRGFGPEPVHVRFLVNKATLEQSFLREQKVSLRQNYSTYVLFPSFSEYNSCQKDGKANSENL